MGNPGIIQLEGVTKFYQRHKALDNLTVTIQEGATGLLGPNGAGKSTLIKSLLGLVRLSSGQATVLGFDIKRSSRQIRQLAGYMPEDDCFISGLKGVELVAYAGELAGLPPRTALRRAHEILDYVMLAEERYREVQTYSTGMKQKVKLAQALIHSPKLVFLDEPTSGLDPHGRDRMIELIRNLSNKKGVSVVVSTHILHDVEACCDSVVILARGKLRVADRLENLQRSVDETYRVHFDGESGPLVDGLREAGCTVEAIRDGEISLSGENNQVPDALFRSAEANGVALRQIVPSRNSLEEIFMDAVAEGGNADP